MSERTQLSTQVTVSQNSSAFTRLLAEVLSTSVEAAAEALGALFDISAPAYSAQELLQGVVMSAQNLSITELEALRQQLPTIPPVQLEPIAKAQGLLKALEENPVLRLGMHSLTQNRSQLHKAQGLLSNARHLLETGSVRESARFAEQAQSLLVNGLQTLHDRLAEAQHRFVVQAAKESLRSLGYQWQAAQREGWTAIWAARGAKGIAVLVSPDNELTIDMLGWEGTACQGELNEFLKALQERGVSFSSGRRFPHGRREGGVLLQGALRIARTRRLPLPQALLIAAEPRLAPQRSTQRLLAALLQQQIRQGGAR